MFGNDQNGGVVSDAYTYESAAAWWSCAGFSQSSRAGVAEQIKRVHKLDLGPAAVPIVRRIFGEFITGHGFYAIAEVLTRDGIPSPSAPTTLPATGTAAASRGRSSPSGRS